MHTKVNVTETTTTDFTADAVLVAHAEILDSVRRGILRLDLVAVSSRWSGRGLLCYHCGHDVLKVCGVVVVEVTTSDGEEDSWY